MGVIVKAEVFKSFSCNCGSCSPELTCLINKGLRDRLELAVGDMVRVRSSRHDTAVFRRVYQAPKVSGSSQFVFLWPDDFRFLVIEPDDDVELSRSDSLI